MIPNDSQLTPLHSAARRGLLEICRLLFNDSRVKHSLNSNTDRFPAFHLACFSGSREVCELFLRNGADITSKTASLNTPLHFASFQEHEDVCELLIETGNISLFCHM